jgi:exonuclease III
MCTVLQWNINGFYKKLDELKILLTEIQPAIICSQETNFKTDNTENLPYYTGYSKNRTEGLRASDGVTVFVKTEYPSRLININTHLEVIAVRVKLKHL